MPGSMTHLLAAKILRPEASSVFFFGNISPDAVSDWRRKDVTHFRNLTNREPALRRAAAESSGDFSEGVLLHFYVDWLWDEEFMDKYAASGGSAWVIPYRRELALAGSYLYHSIPWAADLWDTVAAQDPSCGETPGATGAEVREFIARNRRWHAENRIGPSAVFTPELVEDFARRAAERFRKWRRSV